MHVEFQAIYGFQVGFEFADADIKKALDMTFGFTVDLGIFRIVCGVYNEE